MALKKRERVLTPAEFKAKQKRDYEPFWINSEAIFGANLFPISESFKKQVTILFLLDATDFTTERTTELLAQWNHKYANLRWDGILVFQLKYAFLKNAKFFDKFKNQKIFLDAFGELFDRFGSGKEPVAVVLKDGELISSIPLLPNFIESTYLLEQQLQKALRIGDPGLPLLLSEKNQKINLPIEQKTFLPEDVTTFGEWNGSKNLITSEKNGSSITFPFRGKSLRLIAMAHPNSRDPIKTSITFNEKPLPIVLQNSLIDHEDLGSTTFQINKINGIYDLIQSDTEITGIIKLTFMNAFDNGVVFYSFKTA